MRKSFSRKVAPNTTLKVRRAASLAGPSCEKMVQTKMDKINNPEVAKVFNHYPKRIRPKLLFLRQLVIETASETEGVDRLEESLKWGEPSYLTKCGSTIRMDWKKSKPDKYYLFFHCKTKLVRTFKERYRDKFKFEGNRAIVFHEDEDIPVEELKHCITLSLTYHRIKHLPALGMGTKQT